MVSARAAAVHLGLRVARPGEVAAALGIDPALTAALPAQDAPRPTAPLADLTARLEETERARDAAIADAEAAAGERDEALARAADLEEARHDDAKLRAEAADALDAAIGELKTLSGDRANG